jgi:hypothetical protein
MRFADDRPTLTSNAAPAAPRLILRREGSRRTILDAAWWPRSHDPVVEVSNPVAALDARQITVARIMPNPPAGTTIRVGSGWQVGRFVWDGSTPSRPSCSSPLRMGITGSTCWW